MAAAHGENDLEATMDELRDTYPEAWATCLIRTCEGAPHTHPVQVDDGEWADEPCGSPGKKPCGSGWNADAMRRIDDYQAADASDRSVLVEEHVARISRHMNAGGNVGLAVPVGVMVIDLDDEDSCRLADDVDELACAPCQRTAKGMHLVVQAPLVAIGWPQQTKIPLANGMTIDLRLAGRGQIVCAPSIHATGFQYEWVRELPSSKSELPSLSPSMISMIEDGIGRIKKKQSGAAPRGDGDHVRDGGRNTFLTSRAGRVFNLGISGEALFTALAEINQNECDPPLSEAEVRSIAGSATRTFDRKAEPAESDDDRKPKQVDVLLELLDEVDLFRTAEEDAFADIVVNGHRETHRVRSRAFKQWMRRRYRAGASGSADPKAIDQAVEEAIARAIDEGDERDVCLRVSRAKDGSIYLDLGDESWRAVCIAPNGWTIAESADVPVRFRRPKTLRPLPIPESGGRIDRLREIVNFASDADFVLAVAFLLGALRPEGPHAHLALRGEHGSAKTTSANVLLSTVDPSVMGSAALPSNARDAVISAASGHILSFDNVSSIQPWMSDFLCRLSTGSAAAYRALFTDDELALFRGRRPVILNGITNLVERADLMDRTIFLGLAPIPKEQRRTEEEIDASASEVRPAVLGALLDAVAHGLRRLPETKLDELPRMADFARWVTACETHFWPAGTFMAAYTENRDASVEEGITFDPVASAIKEFMVGRQGRWSGTCQKLLETLDAAAGWAADRKPPEDWPRSAQKLSRAIDRAAAPLRSVGIAISRKRRLISIESHAEIPRSHVTHVTHGESVDGTGGYGMTCPGEGESQHVTHVAGDDVSVAEPRDTSETRRPVTGRNDSENDVPDVSDEGAGHSESGGYSFSDELGDDLF